MVYFLFVKLVFFTGKSILCTCKLDLLQRISQAQKFRRTSNFLKKSSSCILTNAEKNSFFPKLDI